MSASVAPHSERTVPVTTWAGLTATRGKTIDMPLSELYTRLSRHAVRQQKGGPGWSPAKFTTEPPERKSENVESVWLLVQDHDDGTPLDELPAAAARLEWIAYSTFSNTAETPRYRRVFPLSRPVTREEWPAVWEAARTILAGDHLDRSCKDPARLYYWPARTPDADGWSCHHPGQLLDPDWLLAQVRTEPKKPKLKVTVAADTSGQRVPVDVLMRRALDEIQDGRNPRGFWLAQQLRDCGYSKIEAMAVGPGYVACVPDHDANGKPDPYTLAEFEHSVEQVYSRAPRDPWPALEDRKAASNEAASDADMSSDTDEVTEEHSRPPLRILTRAQLAQLPPVEWLVKGRIPRRGLVCFYGPPGAGKTLLATDLAERMTYGGAWNGGEVAAGAVLYLAGEGAPGVKARQQAWESLEEPPPLHELYTLPLRVNFLQAREVEALFAEIRALEVKLAGVFIDTLNRCFVGGDEVSGKDMGQFVDVCDRLKEEFDCTPIVLHHMNAAGERERGHGSLRGSADTMIAVTKTAGMVNVHCDYQKDAEPFDDLIFSMVPVGNSVILGLPGASVGRLTPSELQILRSLSESDSGLRFSDLEKASGVTGGSLTRALNAFQVRGWVNKQGKKRSPLGAYQITYNGREEFIRLAARSSEGCES